ncbi:MAG: putative hemagluttinin, partial [Parcubacteria group bacterium GW2011_GWA2_47_10]
MASSTPCAHSLPVIDGVFNAGIGDTLECSDVLNFNFEDTNSVYLQVDVSSDNLSFETLSPRQRVDSSGFAINAATLRGRVPGNTPNTLLRLDSTGGYTIVGNMGVDTLSGFNGNLLSLQTASTTRFKVDQGARVTIGTDTSSGLSQLTVVSTSSASIPLTLQGFSGQLSNLFQIASSSGANLVMISSGGNLTVTGSTTISGVINASGGINLLSILNCNGSGLLETNSSGGIQCGVDDIGSGGSGDTVFDPINGAIRLTTSTVRVGFGTTTPYAKLSIQGNTNGTPSTTVAILPASGQAANILDIYTTAGVLNTVIDSLNRFGLGTTSPGFTLSVAGTLGVTGTSSLQGAEAIFINDTGNLLVGGTVSITGSSTIQGELNVGATSTLSGIQNTGFITTTGNI